MDFYTLTIGRVQEVELRGEWKSSEFNL